MRYFKVACPFQMWLKTGSKHDFLFLSVHVERIFFHANKETQGVTLYQPVTKA